MDQTPRHSGKCELWEYDHPTIGLGESSCGYSHTYMFDHVIMRVLNCGYICRVAVILKYIHQGMYIWKVFSLLLTLHALVGNCWAKMQFSVGTLTAQASRLIVSPIWERVCMPPPSVRILKILLEWEDVWNVHASCLFMTYISYYSLLKNLIVLTQLNFISPKISSP
jgi:hypothetical protein